MSEHPIKVNAIKSHSHPVPAGGYCLHERRVALGVPGVDGAVVPGQRDLPQLVRVVTLGQEVQEAWLLAGI